MNKQLQECNMFAKIEWKSSKSLIRFTRLNVFINPLEHDLFLFERNAIGLS